MKRILAVGFVVLLLSTACVDETESIRESTSLYWQAVIAGDFDAAYRLLSRESRVRFSRAEFEESLGFGNFTEDHKLRKAWSKKTDFVIEGIKQRGNQAQALIAFHVPDLDALREGLSEEAARKSVERKAKGDTAKVNEWYNKRMTEELRKDRFNRTVLDVETKLIREAGIWKILFNE